VVRGQVIRLQKETLVCL